MSEHNPFEALDALDQLATFAAVLTGMRQQFIDAGWSPDRAEQLVVITFQASLNGAKHE